MADVTQMSDEALVDCVSARHYPDDVQRALAREKSVKVLKDYDAEIRAELLRRLAANARPEQVTMTAREFVQWWYDGYPINHDPILIVADPDFYTKHLTPQQDGDE